MPAKIKDSEMVGKEFGRLTVLSREGSGDRWLCSCDCPRNHQPVKCGKLLRSGQTRSCGCLQSENSTSLGRASAGIPRSHGMTNSKEYIAWKNMKARCDDPNHQAFYNYGGRGITYTESWKDFESFFEDIGHCPDGCSLDRTNTMQDYSKNNCEWVAMKTQAQHKRKPVSGKSSPYKGVSFNKDMGKFKGTLKYEGVLYHLGYHDSDYILAQKYDELLVQLSGDEQGTNKSLGLLMNVAN